VITSRLIIGYIVVPITTALVLVLLFTFVLDKQLHVQGFLPVLALSFMAVMPTSFAITFTLSRTYRNLDHFRLSDDEITVSELQSIITIVYFEIIATAAIIFIYYVYSWKSGDWLPPWFFLLIISPFVTTVYGTFVVLCRIYFRNDFAFHFARKSMIALDGLLREGSEGEVKRIQYLMIALKWYNKFIKRNLKLEFDSSKIYSSVLSRNDKKQTLDELVSSFEIDHKLEKQTLDELVSSFEIDHKLEHSERYKLPKLLFLLRKRPNELEPIELVRIKKVDDPLKPINCLSNIANLPSSESFLIQKKLTTNIKEVALILTAIIPVVITVLQFILPIFN